MELDLAKLQSLIALLRSTGVTEFTAADGTHLKLGVVLTESAAADFRPTISEAGQAMSRAMERLNPLYRDAFEIR